MKVIPFTSLIIPENRQRRSFDEKKLQELATSIMSKGVLHPPVCRFDGENYVLVAGERRTRAIRSIQQLDVGILCNGEFIPPGSLPITLLGDLSPFALREAELEENIVRDDLTWQEKAAAIAELDLLRTDQAAAEGRSHTPRATASEIAGREAVGSEITKVTEALVVAKHLHDPDVAKAKTAKEAMKVIRKKAEALHREKLATEFIQAKVSHVPMLGSCFSLCAEIPDASIDCIITDPPYGIEANSFGDMAGTTHDYQDSIDYAMDCYTLVATEGFRVAKESAHLYVFLDPRHWAQISTAFRSAGWDVWPTPLIWNKLNGMLPKPEYGPRRTYEMILFASKGGRKVLRVGPDVITVPLVVERDHGAQKPVNLYYDLLSRSCYPGDTVLDFFMGSGTVFPAANRLKLQATGMEVNKEYYNLALTRIDQTEDLITDAIDSLTSTQP